MKLTNTTIKNHVCGDRQQLVKDTEIKCLGVLFSPGGGRSFTVTYRDPYTRRRVRRKIGNLNKQTANSNRAVRRSGFFAQQATTQFGDFLVQIGNGQNVFRAFGQ